ncbi:MAG: type II CRISPR RNA-guided endonuclease Cas9 [Bacteroidota bacterium]
MHPHLLRKKAIEGKKLTPQELRRIFFHLAHRRGFRAEDLALLESKEKEKETEEDKKKKKDKKEENNPGVMLKGDAAKGKIGINQTQKSIDSQPEGLRYLGYYLGSIYPTPHQPFKKRERIKGRYTYRKMYQEEFSHIWHTQKKHHPDLLDDAFQKELAHHLFYQRPLQSPPRGKCTLELNKTRALKASLLFQAFDMYKFVNNLRIHDEKLNLTQREHVINFYKSKAVTSKRSFTIEELKGYLEEKPSFSKIYLNYKPKEKIKTASLLPKLEEIFGSAWAQFSEKERIDRWHIIIDNCKKNEAFLIAHAKKKWNLDEKALKNLKNIRTYVPAGVGKYSEKALRYLLPYLEKGFTEDKALLLGSIPKAFGHNFAKERHEGNHWDAFSKEMQGNIQMACEDIVRMHDEKHFDHLKNYLKANYPDKAHALDQLYSPTLKDVKDQQDVEDQLKKELPRPTLTRNPTVNKALFTIRTLINQLLKKHQLPYIPCLKVEMARELKKSEEERQKIANEQAANRNTNDVIVSELIALGVKNPFGDNITKYKLWIESGQRCVYSGDTINHKKLFQDGLYEIEHIVPRHPKDSRQSNLTLCHRDYNQRKNNRTPYEAFYQDPRWEGMKSLAQKCFSRKKYERFISDKPPRETLELTQGDLNLTGYLSKEIAKYLRHVSKKVRFTKGGITAILRKAWDLDTLLAPTIEMPKKTILDTKMGIESKQETYEAGTYFIAVDADDNVLGYAHYTPEIGGRSMKEISKDIKEKYTERKKIKGELKQAEKAKEPTKVYKDDIKKLDKKIKDLYKELSEARKSAKTQRESICKVKSNEQKSGSFPEAMDEMFEAHGLKQKEQPQYFVIEGIIKTADKDGKESSQTFYPTEEKNRADLRHHIVDAFVIGATPLNIVQKLNRENATGKKSEEKIALPWATFREDVKKALSQAIIYRPPKSALFESGKEAFMKKVRVPKYPDPLQQKPSKKHQWITNARGDRARGELHKATYYGRYTHEGKAFYHIRKSLDEITKSQAENIVNPEIRKKIEKIIEKEMKIDKEKKIKNILFETIKEGKNTVEVRPKIFLSNKREGGEPVPVKKVRIRKSLSNTCAISKDKNRWVDLRNNHLLAFYEKEDESWVAHIYTRKESIDLLRAKKEFPSKTKEGGSLVLALQQDDLCLLYPPSFLLDNDFSLEEMTSSQREEIVDSLYRVQKFSAGDFYFRKHTAGTLKNPLERIQSSEKNIKEKQIMKVIVDPTGAIQSIFDPIHKRSWVIK